MSEIIRTAAMIAGEINAIKDQVRTTALMASVEIGKRLQEAKGLVPEGEWTAWLLSNVAYSVRTAQNLMALAAEFAAGHGQIFDNLNYTKAVMLLSVPESEREEFVADHDIEGMSTRQLQQTINELKKRNDEMQITMDQLLKEQAESPAAEMQGEIENLRSELKRTQQAVETAKDVNATARQKAQDLRSQLADAKKENEQLKQEAEEERARLQQALAEAQKKQVIQQVTPPEVEKELEELRSRIQRTNEEQSIRAGYEIVKSSFSRLKHQLQELEQQDAALARDFRAAFAKSLRMMADMMEAQHD